MSFVERFKNKKYQSPVVTVLFPRPREEEKDDGGNITQVKLEPEFEFQIARFSTAEQRIIWTKTVEATRASVDVEKVKEDADIYKLAFLHNVNSITFKHLLNHVKGWKHLKTDEEGNELFPYSDENKAALEDMSLDEVEEFIASYNQACAEDEDSKKKATPENG